LTERNTDRRASSDLLEAFDASTRSASAACHFGSQIQAAVDTLGCGLDQHQKAMTAARARAEA
jgi:hypothetical protein